MTRSLLLSILLAGRLAAQGQLADNEDYKKGLEAIADNLPELAIERLERSRSPSLSKDESRVLTLLLAEAHVRAAQPAQALDRLATLSKSTDSLFWRAQALATDGRYAEAVAVFREQLARDGTGELASRARLTLSSLLFSLQKYDESITALEPLAAASDTSFSPVARLRIADMLLQRDRLDEAKRYLEAELPSPAEEPLAQYLKGRLALASGDLQTASAQFSALLEKRDSLPARLADGAALGVVKAEMLAERTAEGMAAVSAFIDNHSDGPLLDQAFHLLKELAPQNDQQRRVILEKLATWSPRETLSSGPVPLGDDGSALSVSPHSTRTLTRRETLALLARGQLAQTTGEPDITQAIHVLHQLRLLAPTSEAAASSLLETGLLLQKAGRTKAALAAFNDVQTLSSSAPAVAKAAFLAGQTLLISDPDAALDEFKLAAAVSAGPLSQVAEENAALLMLSQGRLDGVSDRIAVLPDAAVKASLQLELALSLAEKSVVKARTRLGAFLQTHPDHPRAAEAHLALASTLATAPGSDLEAAAAQLAHLSDDSAVDPGTLTLTRMKVANLQRLLEESVSLGETFLETYPDHPAQPQVQLKLAQALYQTGKLIRANLTLKKLAGDESNTREIRETAYFFAALSASGGGTVQSREEALPLLGEAIKLKGDLESVARSEKAFRLMKFGRFKDALEELDIIRQQSKPGSDSWLRAHLLAARSHLSVAPGDATRVREAIETLDQAYAQPDLGNTWNNRILFQRGLAYEKLAEALSDAKKSDNATTAALDSYYIVISREITSPEGYEWKWFEECAFRAIRLLIDSERWKSAIAIARKVAASSSPRAAEANQLADRLTLEHMVFDAP